jgi:hypothetical protein
MTRDEKGQFVKGHPGMGGRKPKSYNEKALEAVSRACKPDDIQAIMEVLVKKAQNGNIQAAKVVLSYAIGMPVQRTEITGADGGPVEVKEVEVVKDYGK